MLEHISYSQYNAYTRCARSWYLDKIRQGEPKMTWFLPIGTAVHQMIEDYVTCTGSRVGAEAYFFPAIEAQLRIEPDLSKWLAGGPKADPVTEDKALRQVKDCFDKALEFLDEIDVWEVEYDASGNLPGLEVPVKAYIDIIGEHKKHGPVILDWKTGKQKPKDSFQLETYGALLKMQEWKRLANPVGSEPATPITFTGLWAMLNPLSAKARPVSLADVDPAEVGAKYQKVYERMRDKLYPTNHGYDCRFCFQASNCKLESGLNARTMYYDKAEEMGYPF